MKSLTWVGMGMTGFSLAMLLSQCAIAYPSIRLATIVLLFVLFAACVLLSGTGMVVARAKLGCSAKQSDMAYGASPGLMVAFVILIGSVVGLFVGV